MRPLAGVGAPHKRGQSWIPAEHQGAVGSGVRTSGALGIRVPLVFGGRAIGALVSRRPSPLLLLSFRLLLTECCVTKPLRDGGHSEKPMHVSRGWGLGIRGGSCRVGAGPRPPLGAAVGAQQQLGLCVPGAHRSLLWSGGEAVRPRPGPVGTPVCSLGFPHQGTVGGLGARAAWNRCMFQGCPSGGGDEEGAGRERRPARSGPDVRE